MLFGVISFPGTNCETEAVRALKKVGFDAKIILWNESEESFNKCDGFLIAGGFSYEDRGRSGVISANDKALDYIKKANKEGKPIIGICNGAQILVESGIVTDSETPKISLTFNKRVKDGEVQGVYYHEWIYLKNTAKTGRSPFNNFDSLIKMPIAHGEGRFIIDEEVLKEMKVNDQIVFVYSDENGEVKDEYPINPNGSCANIAGVCNKSGNALALMPHPERSGKLAEDLFIGLKKWIEENKPQITNHELQKGKKIEVKSKENFDIEFFIKTIITDNSEETIKSALNRKLGKDIYLKRMRHFGINLDGDSKKEAKKIIETDELANTNKETVYVKINNEWLVFKKGEGIVKNDMETFFGKKIIYVCDNEDLISQAKKPKIEHEGIKVKKIQSAICWVIDFDDEEKIIQTGILANPVSMHIKK